jgi:hypothetical protein
MSKNSLFSEPINFIGRDEKPKKTWPWELPKRAQDSPNFFRDIVCSVYLAKLFCPSPKYPPGNNYGYDFIRESDNRSFSVKYICLAKGMNVWSIDIRNVRADSILHFGFRDKIRPLLEFCLDIPVEKFKDRNRISIWDDGYHIKGYKEFWLDADTFSKMQEVMNGINDQDSAILGKYFTDG